jgi:hypothetical protein
MDENKCNPVVQNRESVKVIPSKVGRRSRRAKNWEKIHQYQVGDIQLPY